MIYSFPAVWSVMSTLLSRMELSTIVEGQTLGTVHIMEGTCSRLRFFFREKYDHRHVHIHIHIHNFLHIHF